MFLKKVTVSSKPKTRNRSISEISIMQLQARREKRRTKGKFNVNTPATTISSTSFSSVPMRPGLIEENLLQRRYVFALLLTLFVQTIAIFWNMFTLWNPNEPEVWNDNVSTRTAKSIITTTCIILTVLVILIRLTDLKQLPEGSSMRRYYSFIVMESFFLMIHVPPLKLGVFKTPDDVWNILGTAKYYLVLELCKIYHPL